MNLRREVTSKFRSKNLNKKKYKVWRFYSTPNLKMIKISIFIVILDETYFLEEKLIDLIY